MFRKKKKNNNQARRSSIQRSSDNQRVISYYTASRQQLDNFDRKSAAKSESNAAAARRIQNIKRAWFSLFSAVVLMAVVGYSVTLSKEPSVVINGDLYRSQADYEKLSAEAFGNNPLNLFKPTLQEAKLTEKLRQVFPEARDITVKSSLLGHNPEVIIETDKPLAQLQQPNGEKVVLGERGRLLLPSAEALDSFNTLPTLINATSVDIQPGQQFIRPDEANAYRRLMGQYNTDGSKPQGELVAMPQEILMRDIAGGGVYYVRYLLNDEIVQQYGAYKAAIKELSKSNSIPAEYLDVRLAEKVFYK